MQDTKMADLPTPLITIILSKLPVKSLLRFRCVAKSWCSLIDDQYFVNLHLKNSLQNPNHHTLIIKDSFLQNVTDFTVKDPYLYSIDYPTLKRATPINCPFNCDSVETVIVGSSDGLICFADGIEVIIYNPATRKHRVLPVSPVEIPGYVPKQQNRVIYGFGYDHRNADYKLVRIIEIFNKYDDNHISEMKVYSLKANTWRRICQFSDFPNNYYLGVGLWWSGVYLNECLHWLGVRKPISAAVDVLVAFDVGTEECKVLPLPRYDGGNLEYFSNVGVIDGCITVRVFYPNHKLDVWIMKEYGVKESWTKLFSIPQRDSIGFFSSLKPIVYSKKKNGSVEVLFEKDFDTLVWIDVKRLRLKKVNTRGLPRWFDTALLVESLVPLDTPMKKKKKSKKKRNAHLGQLNSQLATLPTVLLYNIWSRLPAMTLLQLKCVCKEWNNLIHEPDFAKLHLEVSGKCNENLNLIIREKKLHLVDLNLNRAVQVNHPLTCPEGWTIEGSCNGLLCISNQVKDVALWNPLTGRCCRLPISESQSQNAPNVLCSFVYGFGYDPIFDDYKVVQSYYYCGCDEYGFLDPESDTFAGSEVHVYSSKAKCWRRIDDFPYILCYACPGVFASGALHWIARRKHELDSTSYLILAFDLGAEKCRVVQQPEYDDIHFHISLGHLGESLCIICTYPKRGADIWVMKDSNQWCKLISLTHPRPIKFFEYIKPLIYSKNGSEVLLELDYKKFIWYNLQKKTIRHVNISHLPNSFETEVFLGSVLDPENIGVIFERRTGLIGTENSSHQNQMRNDSLPRQKEQPILTSSLLAAFPDKVLCRIFSQLPVKTLLQIQCVCKTWYDLIHGPEFIKMHLEVPKYGSELSLVLKGDRFLSVNAQLVNEAIEISHPLLCDNEYTDIVGSCNGLICLCRDQNLALWNPYTGKHEKIPCPDFHFEQAFNVFCYFVHGFGYDSTTDDYKIVSILQQHNLLKGGIIHTDVQVYSLGAKSWKQLHHFPYFVCYPCFGVYTSGALHWVARQSPDLYSSSNLLIALDLGVEKCRVVAQPNYIDTDFQMSLGLLGGSLCFLCNYPKESLDLWVMADYLTESWMKLLSISQHNVIRCFEYMKPLAYSEDGSEVLFVQDNEKLLWYSLTKKTVKYIQIPGLPKAFDAVICSSSIVPIGNATRKYQVIHEQPFKGSQKSRKKKERNDASGFLSKGFKLKL